MKLPLKGLEEFVRRAGRPEAEIAEAAKRKGDYFLSERQAKAILEMRLSRLTGLEREKLADEYGELCDEIARLRAILAERRASSSTSSSMSSRRSRRKFGDKRRTEIVADRGRDRTMEDLIQEEDMVVTISHAGYVKRTPPVRRTARRSAAARARSAWRRARKTGSPSSSWRRRTRTSSSSATSGKVYVKKVYEIPLAARNAKGRAIVNFVGMEPGEKVAAIIAGAEDRRRASSSSRSRSAGRSRRPRSTEYENFREKGIIGVKIEEGDQLLARRPHRRHARVPHRDRSRACRSASPRSRCARWAAPPSA